MLYHHLFNKPEIVEMGLPCQLLVGSVPLRGYCFRCGPRRFTQRNVLVLCSWFWLPPGSLFCFHLWVPTLTTESQFSAEVSQLKRYGNPALETPNSTWRSGELFCWHLTSGQRTASRSILKFLTARRVCASVAFPVYVTIWGWSLGPMMLEGSFCCSLSKFTDAGNHNYLDILCLVNRVSFHWTAVSTIVLQTFAFSR